MNSRPILFSGPMVRAILGGYKTQTRRIVKPQRTVYEDAGRMMWAGTGYGTEAKNHCPFGVPGDELWVRETFTPRYFDDGKTAYRADFSHLYGKAPRWKPSIHMPRSHSRLTLEITGIEVERLQATSEIDAKSEGILGCIGRPCTQGCKSLPVFREVWDELYGPGSWDLNPWVWKISFKRTDKWRET